MSSVVLQNRTEIKSARIELRSIGASCLTPWPIRFLRRWGLLGGVTVGDPLKSWDILNTVRFIRERLPVTASILDIGAFSSEVLPALHRLGYSSLTGVDLNPEIRKMPHANLIRYEVTDFMKTPFANESFDAITAISVIEHGFNPLRLLAEISRLLRPGGYFIASFDYWPEKIETTGMKIFGMNWTIFSRTEVLYLILNAKSCGIEPGGDIALDVKDRVIRFGGKQYTFGWLALRKTT